MRWFPLWPERASTAAPDVDNLYIFMLLVCGLVALVVFLLIFYFAIKYRRRSDTEIPKPNLGSLPMELSWILLPLVIFAIMFGWGARIYFRNFDAPPDALRVYVMGKQWMWKVHHPDGQAEINELHVPVGRPVQLILASQDVIHSFFIPAFRIKMDAVPGRYTSIWFQATRPGTYHLFCAEYCGTEHSRMIGSVHVLEARDYERWLGTVAGMGDTMAAAGEQLFRRLGCDNCHPQIAPNLEGLYTSQVVLADGRTVRADEAYLRRSILDPAAEIVAGYPSAMPSYRGQISEEELLQLIAYIRSLAPRDRPGAPPEAAPAGREQNE